MSLSNKSLADRYADLQKSEAAFERRKAIEPELRKFVEKGNITLAQKPTFSDIFAAISDDLKPSFLAYDGKGVYEFLWYFLNYLNSPTETASFAAPKKKNCSKGVSCGNTCISGNKICRKPLTPPQKEEVKEVLAQPPVPAKVVPVKIETKSKVKVEAKTMPETANKLKAPIKVGGSAFGFGLVTWEGIPSDAKVIGKGFFGVAFLSDNKVYKKTSQSDLKGNQMAMKVQNLAAEAGVAPRVFSATENLMVMDKAEGETLKGLAKTEQRREAIESSMRAIVKMHKAGIIHKDLHPGNILYSREKGATIIDFGSAQTVSKKSKDDENVNIQDIMGVSWDVQSFLEKMKADGEDRKDSEFVAKMKKSVKENTYGQFLREYNGK